MRIENGVAVLETRPCHCTYYVGEGAPGAGKVFKTFPCKDKKTFGYCIKARCPNNKSGKRGETHDARPPVIVTCGSCKGTTIVPENYTDRIALRDTGLPWFIVRQNRNNSFNESYLGMGCLWSCTDYGDAAASTDAQLIEKLASGGEYNQTTQLCNIVRSKDDLRLCDAIVVYVTRDGYSVRAFYKEEGLKRFSGLSQDEELSLARVIAGPHGNQTMVAAMLE